jgi:glycosyltransferase involved in cell wall biosynthesis
MLENITPVVLTWNEAENVGRCLERLRWAGRVVVVDSGSDDATSSIVGGFPNAVLVTRAFDRHADQWNFAVHETGIVTEWVLALDADYMIPPELVAEMGALLPDGGIAGYRARFRYVVAGRPLRGSLYPPVMVLFRRSAGRYIQDGHTQVLEVSGRVGELNHRIDHDDRKPLRRWLLNQDRYIEAEAEKLISMPRGSLSIPDRLRKALLAPFLVVPYTLFVKGTILDGLAGLHYTWQRAVAEMILAMKLIERRLRG